MNRTVNVVRMQFANRQTFIWIPLIVLAGAIVISFAIFAAIPTDEPIYGGGAQAPMWYLGVVGMQALTLTFPFSQAMSISRREFFSGTLLAGLICALGLSAIFTVGGVLEQATHGWWINGYLFYLPWIWEAGPLAAFFIYVVGMMFFFITWFWAATIYKRFGTLWVVVTLVGIGLLIVAGIGLVTQIGAWPAIGAWFVQTGSLGLALWALLPVAAMTLGAYRMILRTIP